MFVWVLLILNDFQLDCKLIGTFSDHHAGPSRMQKPRRRPHFVFYLFKKKKEDGRWRQQVSHATGKCPDVLHTLTAHG